MGLIPNSAATDAGLESDDCLLSVGTATKVEAYKEIKSQNWGTPLTVLVPRGSGPKAQILRLPWTLKPGPTGTGFRLLPVSVASGTCLPVDAKKLQRPRRTKYLISNTYGRPRAPPVASRWVGHGFPTYDEANLPYTLNFMYDTQKLDNKTGVCYRNAATTQCYDLHGDQPGRNRLKAAIRRMRGLGESPCHVTRIVICDLW